MKRSLACLALAAATALACREQATPAPEAAPSAAPSSRAVTAPSATAGAAERAWYEGSWSGTYESALHRIELPVGGVRAWKDDDGKAGSGTGTLNLSIAQDGRVSGEAEGPLGPLTVSGELDGETLRVHLAPDGGGGKDFRGVLVAGREGDRLRGTLRASTGDSLVVRAAPVELNKASK